MLHMQDTLIHRENYELQSSEYFLIQESLHSRLRDDKSPVSVVPEIGSEESFFDPNK